MNPPASEDTSLVDSLNDVGREPSGDRQLVTTTPGPSATDVVPSILASKSTAEGSTVANRTAIRKAEATQGTVVIDFRVEQEDTVYPMVPAGADLQAMIRRPGPAGETALDA